MKAKMEQRKAEFDKKLNLTEDQKAKMKAIHESSKSKMHGLFEKLRAKKAKWKNGRI